MVCVGNTVGRCDRVEEVGDEIFHTGTHQSPLSRGLLSPCILGAPLPCHPQYSREVSAIFVVGGHTKMAQRRRRFFQGTQAASLLVLWEGADPAETPSPQLDPRLNRPLHLTGPAATQPPALVGTKQPFPSPPRPAQLRARGCCVGAATWQFLEGSPSLWWDTWAGVLSPRGCFRREPWPARDFASGTAC